MSYVGPGNVHGQITNLQGVLPNGLAIDSEGVAGAYVYTVTCGTGSNQQQANATVNWFTNYPAVTLTANNPWPLGFADVVNWSSNVYPCTGTGGSAGDGWAGSKAGPLGSQNLTESNLGSLTFGITCGSGAQIVAAQAATSVITPTVSINASASTLAINQSLVITWTVNFAPCTSSISPGSPGGWGSLLPNTGGFNTTEIVPGTYTYAINCEGAQASTRVTFTGPTPIATLTASAASAAVTTPITLTWTSPGGSTCTASGGESGDGWSGPVNASGSQSVTSFVTEAVTYSIACAEVQGQLQAQTQVTFTAVGVSAPSIPTPAVTLSASGATEVVGTDVTLTWNSQNASACTASGGGNGDGWTGNLTLSGNMAVTESQAGPFTYSITCTGAPPAATVQADVKFTDITVTGGSSPSSGGGGGALDSLCLLPLCLLASRRLYLVAKRSTDFHAS